MKTTELESIAAPGTTWHLNTDEHVPLFAVDSTVTITYRCAVLWEILCIDLIEGRILFQISHQYGALNRVVEGAAAGLFWVRRTSVYPAACRVSRVACQASVHQILKLQSVPYLTAPTRAGE